MRPRSMYFALLLFLAGGMVVAYRPSLHGPFVFDDMRNIVENPTLQGGWSSLASALQPPEGFNARPLAFLTFALNYRIGGVAPFGFHLANLAILLVSIPIAFWLARLLCGSWHPAGPSLALAATATVLWISNPLLTNGVTYIVQRMTSLSVLFSLLALACFVRGWRGDGSLWHAGAAFAWAAAAATKESALVLPLPALLYARLTSPPGTPRARWSGVALLGGIVATQAALIIFAPQFLARKWIPPWSFTLTERFLTEGRVVADYLSLFFWPLPSRLNIEHQVAISSSLLNPPSTLLAFALHGALIAGAILLRRARPLLSLCVLSFYLLQLAEGTFLPVDLMFEHRVYFPGFFLALGLADLGWWGLERLAPARAEQALLAVAVLIGLFWSTLTYQRNRTWADPVELWRDTVAKSPGIARARYNLGASYAGRRDYRKAEEQFLAAVGIQSYDFRSRFALGVMAAAQGRTEEAIVHYEEALKFDPGDAKARSNLGVALTAAGRAREAIPHLQKALQANGKNAVGYVNLGLAYVALKQWELAAEPLRSALRLDPDNEECLFNLAYVSERLGRREESIGFYRHAILANPSSGRSRLNLGLLYLGLGMRAEALAEYRDLQNIDAPKAAALGRLIGP